MTFNGNHEHDVKVHEEFHNRFSSTKPFHVRPQQMDAWKKWERPSSFRSTSSFCRHVKFETITTKSLQTTIFHLDQSSTSTLRKKVDEIVEVRRLHSLPFPLACV